MLMFNQSLCDDVLSKLLFSFSNTEIELKSMKYSIYFIEEKIYTEMCKVFQNVLHLKGQIINES